MWFWNCNIKMMVFIEFPLPCVCVCATILWEMHSILESQRNRSWRIFLTTAHTHKGIGFWSIWPQLGLGESRPLSHVTFSECVFACVCVLPYGRRSFVSSGVDIFRRRVLPSQDVWGPPPTTRLVSTRQRRGRWWWRLRRRRQRMVRGSRVNSDFNQKHHPGDYFFFQANSLISSLANVFFAKIPHIFSVPLLHFRYFLKVNNIFGMCLCVKLKMRENLPLPFKVVLIKRTFF